MAQLVKFSPQKHEDLSSDHPQHPYLRFSCWREENPKNSLARSLAHTVSSGEKLYLPSKADGIRNLYIFMGTLMNTCSFVFT